MLSVMICLSYARNVIWLNEIDLAKDCAEKSPSKARTIEHLAYLYLQDSATVKDVDAVRDELQKIIQQNIDDVKLYNILGITYLKLHVYQKAHDAFKKALFLAPDNADTYVNIAAMYGMIGEYTASLEASRKALVLNPVDKTAYNNIGLAYASVGRHPEAIPMYEKSLELDPAYEEARYNLELSRRAMNNNKITR